MPIQRHAELAALMAAADAEGLLVEAPQTTDERMIAEIFRNYGGQASSTLSSIRASTQAKHPIPPRRTIYNRRPAAFGRTGNPQHPALEFTDRQPAGPQFSDPQFSGPQPAGHRHAEKEPPLILLQAPVMPRIKHSRSGV